MFMFKTIAATSLLALSLAAPAAASGLTDNFDAESPGSTILNYNGFANFDVGNGTVDLLFDPNGFGLACAGGSGSCVDLDGSTRDGGYLTTKNFYSFNAGDKVTLSFDLSGNMRQAGDDNFLAGFSFQAPVDVLGYTLSGGYFPGGPFDFLNSSGVSSSSTIGQAKPFTTYILSFTAGSAGALKAYVGTDSNDNIGPILDNFSLNIAGGVPEPSQWMLLILGFGAIGATMRRKSAAVRYA